MSHRHTGSGQHDEEQDALGNQGVNLGIGCGAGSDQNQAEDVSRQANSEQGAQITGLQGGLGRTQAATKCWHQVHGVEKKGSENNKLSDIEKRHNEKKVTSIMG